MGNRQQKVVKDGTGTTLQTTDYTYNANDWLLRQHLTTSSGGNNTTGYSYDSNGNQTAVIADPDGNHQVTPYLYDFENHLVQVGLSSTDHTSYTYDAQGQRLSTTTTDSNGTRTTRYLVDGSMGSGQVLREMDGQGNYRARYDWAGCTN